MNDDTLGNLAKDEQLKGALNGRVTHKGRQVSLHIDPDGGPLPQCLQLAKTVVSALAELDDKAKVVASRRYVKIYNEAWREYQEADGKGGFVEVSEPELSEAAFKSRITLRSISIMGASLCSFEYSDDGLFSGHAILVTSFDGLGFSNVDAQLWG